MQNPLDQLVKITQDLRAPNGCPWDKQQTHESVKNYFIEEVYEVIDAIDNQDMGELREELGDVLFQIIFHCQLAQEKELFDIYDVIREVNEKMIRRHPHVFENPPTDDVEMVLEQWEEIKKNEPHQKKRTSQLDGIPHHLPVLHKTLKTVNKAAKTDHYEIPAENISLQNIHTLLNEMPTADQENKDKLMAKILFSCVELSAQQKIHPEEALREHLKEFTQSYKQTEQKYKDS